MQEDNKIKYLIVKLFAVLFPFSIFLFFLYMGYSYAIEQANNDIIFKIISILEKSIYGLIFLLISVIFPEFKGIVIEWINKKK